MIEVNYNEYKETIAQNMKLVVENHDLKQEIKRLKEEIKGYEQERERVLNVIDERNHKAIEYIKEKARNNCWIDQYEANDLIKILKGDDKE